MLTIKEQRFTKQLEAKLVNDQVIVALGEAQDLRGSGYGEVKQGDLVLNAVEALYLLDKNKIAITDELGKALSFRELVDYFSKKDENLWLRYLLYADLRRRGYVVKLGFKEKSVEFRVYQKGAEAGKEVSRYLVVGVAEGATLEISELFSLAERARRMRKELILAVVDRQGDIAYYDVSWARL